MRRCANHDCSAPLVEEIRIRDFVSLWSDASSWPSGEVPVAGDDVVIPEGANMLLDFSPPVFNTITINGRLTFENVDPPAQGKNITL